MRTNVPVGISGYGAYIPKFRIRTEEIGRVWKGRKGPNELKSVANLDEDAVTMSVEAALRAFEMAKVSSLGAVLVGSESPPYAVKPTATIVSEVLGQHLVLSSDLEFACKAGTEAFQLVTGLVGSGMIDAGMAIGVDTAQGRPGDELEYTASCGAVAYILARDDYVAEIEGSVSYVTDTPDFWRRQGEMYPRHLSRFTGEPAYFHHIEGSVRRLFQELGLRPSDFKYAVFHQPNPKYPVKVGLRLGFSYEQLKPGLLNNEIGNTYAASSILGLAAILDEARPGERILAASFGSGAGSDAISLVVTDRIEEKRPVVRVRDMLKGEEIDYALYLKFRGEIRV